MALLRVQLVERAYGPPVAQGRAGGVGLWAGCCLDSPASRIVHQMFLFQSSPTVVAVCLDWSVAPRPPWRPPANRRAGHRPLGSSWFASPSSVPVTACQRPCRTGVLGTEVTPASRQALFLVQRDTNGSGWEDHGAVYVRGANALGHSPTDRGCSPVGSNASPAVGVAY